MFSGTGSINDGRCGRGGGRSVCVLVQGVRMVLGVVGGHDDCGSYKE